MCFYADRMLIHVLAFSLAPVVALLTTALSNINFGLMIGIISFVFIVLQPTFSDICLKNTSEGLGLKSIVCAEGKVTYYGSNFTEKGKLFLSKEALVFVVDNQIEFTLPLCMIVNANLQLDSNEVMDDLKPLLELKSPNLPQLVSMVGQAAEELDGLLIIKVKQHIFFNTYCFQVSYPRLWKEKISEMTSDYPSD